MLDGVGISDLFSRVGAVANNKFLILGSAVDSLDSLLNRTRSLNLEHVSPAELMAQEISRRTSLGQKAERAKRSGLPVPEETVVAVMRRWFWARKPDAGFVLRDFPATLLQARIFDEWLDTRNEALSAVIWDGGTRSEPLVDHYRTLGVLTLTPARVV